MIDHVSSFPDVKFIRWQLQTRDLIVPIEDLFPSVYQFVG